jgi:hypothetical protein
MFTHRVRHHGVASSIVAACSVSVLLLGACWPEKHKVRVGPDVRADIVVLFVRDAPPEVVETFWHEVLQRQRPDGRGYEFRSGIMSVLRCPPLEGHEALAIDVQAGVAQAQRDALMRRIEASPVVYRTFRNTVPLEIHGVR